MTFEAAVRLTEIAVSLALIQRGLEHVFGRDRILFGAQILCALALLADVWSGAFVWALWGLSVLQLLRFQGPYNGGSDKMAILILTCLGLAHGLAGSRWAEMALAYLAVQLVLSYAVSGWVKLTSADWQRGQALRDVFGHSAYPVSDGMRGWARHPRKLWVASWGVIAFETAFPLAFLHPVALCFALTIAALFHGANAVLFGLNRFLWTWLAAFPSVVWLQARLFGA
ncbi:MAG: HTTM domain-containing protein [Pseudomonadota bacterium]